MPQTGHLNKAAVEAPTVEAHGAVFAPANHTNAMNLADRPLRETGAVPGAQHKALLGSE